MKDVVKKVKLHDELTHKDGCVILWGHTCHINPVIGVIIKDKFIEKIASSKKQKIINYFAENHQAQIGAKIVGERFGYVKTYKNKKDFLEFLGSQFELLGYGNVKWVRMDFDKKHFVVRMESPYAKVHKETFGLIKETVDYWNAGAWAALAGYTVDQKLVCIETSCIAKGDKVCEFTVKPIKNWDKKDPLVKKNAFLFKAPNVDLGKRRI